MTVEINDQGQMVMRECIDMSQGDVILRCEDGSVPCHKVVLAALSPMLETILREATGEEPPTIILPDIKLRTLTTFLTEFYVNSVSDVNTEMASLLGFKLRELGCDSPKTSDSMSEAASKESLKNPEELKWELDPFKVDTSTPQLPILTEHSSDLLKLGDDLRDERPSFEELDPFIDIKEESESHDQKSEENEETERRIVYKNNRKTYVEYSPTDPRTNSYYCDICEKGYETEWAINRHRERYHNIYIEKRPCPKCGKKVKNLQTHSERNCVGLSNCNFCKKTMSSEIIREHKISCESRPTKSMKKICNICGGEYFNVKAHVERVHTNLPRSHLCHICEKGFKEKSLLKHHMKVHAERKPCPHCGLQVRRLNEHIISIHTPDELRPFQCSECTKGFASSNQLKHHQMNVHLKLRPYKCRYGCDDSYNDTSNRNSHEKKKHGKLFTTVEKEKEKRLREEDPT